MRFLFFSQPDLYRGQLSFPVDTDTSNQVPGLPWTLEFFDLHLPGATANLAVQT